MTEAIDLNGGWLVAIDPENRGKSDGWAASIRPDALPAPVPGVFQQVFPFHHGTAWYYRTLRAPFPAGERLLLRFGAADYLCEVYIDGTRLPTRWLTGRVETFHEGPESPFDVDVTEALAGGGEHLLAVRVVNPPAEGVFEGLERSKIPSRNIGPDEYRAGACASVGGITLPVALAAVPRARIADVFVRCGTDGAVTLDVSVEAGAAASGTVTVRVTPGGGQLPCAEGTFDAAFGAGVTAQRFSLRVDSPRLWSFDDPYLYDFALTLRLPDGESAYTVTSGFRDFRVENGYFRLNGKRVFLKSAHTGNCFPIGMNVATLPGLELDDFRLAKASGFNCVRFIATMATPRQLDYCDRLGLMVYEEAYASWCLGDSPRACELFEESLSSMILRDRNHASVTIWGLLNETAPGDACYAARSFLPKLRALDDTRLVLYSSGRFDLIPEYAADPDYSVGSLANPGVSHWECQWGDEGGDTRTELTGNDANLAMRGGAGAPAERTPGDYHRYLGMPMTPEIVGIGRSIGRGCKPVFLSECGVGSQYDVVTLAAQFAQHGVREDNPDLRVILDILRCYRRDWAALGCDRAYAEPLDFLRESNRYNAVTRAALFDIVRANPRICGYNVTGLLDHALCGEGPFTLFRQYKQRNFDAFAEGWAPVRWCLFASHGHVLRGDEITLEAVLANEDALPDGDYTARFAVTDERGRPCARYEARFSLPMRGEDGEPPLAFPVFRQTLRADFPAGKYIFKAYLDGAYAAGGEKVFFVSGEPDSAAPVTVAAWRLPEDAKSFLRSHNVAVDTLPAPDAAGVVFVGPLPDGTALAEATALLRAAESGATVVFLDPLTFDHTKPAAPALPVHDPFCFTMPSWVYHKEELLLPHRWTAGLPAGHLDWDFADAAYPRQVLITDTTPAECASAFFEVGNFEWVTGRNQGKYHGGSLLGLYPHGRGAFVPSMFPLLERVGHSPMGDRLLLALARG